jgi:hypothetical protein
VTPQVSISCYAVSFVLILDAQRFFLFLDRVYHCLSGLFMEVRRIRIYLILRKVEFGAC